MQQTDRLVGFDFSRHNAEVKGVWAAHRAKKPTRVPIILGIGTRFYVFSHDANPAAVSFRNYSEDVDVMFDCQLRFQRWNRFNLLQDAELGLPEKWMVGPDFQNYYEAAWFGCPIEYFENQVPDTRPAFSDQPERVMEQGLPDPLGGLMNRAREYYEHMRARAQRETFLDRPIDVHPLWCGIGADGIMTVACNLFGPDFVCEAMAAEPARLQKLLAFITEATIRRLTTWRTRCGLPVPCEEYAFADDSIALISTAMYREHVLPHHRRLCDALSPPTSSRSIHLCGDATRHFKTLRDELNVRLFDTGFPVNFGTLRRELGPGVVIQGGPHIEFLRTAKPAAVREDVRRILESGVLDGGLFVLREGNNLAPGTPLENTEALYQAGRDFGRLTDN